MGSQSSEWERTIATVIPAVVCIKYVTVSAFDTHKSGSSTATGFVVDAERGIVLTNAHVVTEAPVNAYGVFHNYEEVPLIPVYRDPVHDFGFFRYDVTQLRFLEDLTAVRLAPELAQVGVDIRVIGNDAGEKLSILQSTLARLDRKAPHYGNSSSNDHNTFYFQAASGTSGGSSGSPVIIESGECIALNAGGKTHAASSFYLPLDRVVRALGYVQQEQAVPRGTVCVKFELATFDECRRLGLPEEEEARAREAFSGAVGQGLLVVRRVLPEGPGDGHLEEGDMVLTVNGAMCNAFVTLEEAMDSAVGGSLALEVVRSGGACHSVTCGVVDLHGITPDAYLSYSRGVLHNLSYHLAMNYLLPLRGVYVASAGYALGNAHLSRHNVITHINHEATPDVDAAEAVLAALPDGKEVPLRFFDVSDSSNEHVEVMVCDRAWFPMCRYTRDDTTGLWAPTLSLAPTTALVPPEPRTTAFSLEGGRIPHLLGPSLCMVEFHIPHGISGCLGSRYMGGGLVVDAAQGLVVVDRNTVPIGLGDVRLVFANSVHVPGQIVFLSPLHNFAVVSYDPALLGDTPIAAARVWRRDVSEAKSPLAQGQEVWFVGLTREHITVARRSTVAKISKFRVNPFKSGAFRQMNVEVAQLDQTLHSTGGVLVDNEGVVLAVWSCFATAVTSKGIRETFAGLDIDLVTDVTDALSQGEIPQLWALDAELWTVSLSRARAFGLSDEWVHTLEGVDRRHQALIVEQTAFGSSAAEMLLVGDLVLAVDGVPVCRFRDFERAIQCQPEVTLTVWRKGEEHTLTVALTPVVSDVVDRFVSFQGALIQDTFRDLRFQQKKVPDGVYITGTASGSPAHLYSLPSRSWLVSMNGVATPTLDALLGAVRDLEEGATVRAKCINSHRKVKVCTLRISFHYHPTTLYVHSPHAAGGGDAWSRTLISPPASSSS